VLSWAGREGGRVAEEGLPFAEVRSGLDGRFLSAMELAEACLERIEALPQLNAYRYVDDEGALGRAAQADRELDAGELLGPLHGIPIGIKESFGVEGLPFSAGCLAFEDFHAPADADVVALARAGGAVILGVQRMRENAMGLMVRDGARATGANPRHPDFAPGGSSSGSAAATRPASVRSRWAPTAAGRCETRPQPAA